MKILNSIIVILLALLGSWIDIAQAKCSLIPLEGDRTPLVAYACVQVESSDIDEIPNDAEWIEFTVSHIRNLQASAFSRFQNLRRLTFYNCDLRDLSHDVFHGLDNLEWLVMSNTQIGLARAELFQNLHNLKRLTLDGAGLVYIEPEVFHNFRRLETLSLRDNDLDCLPIDALHSLQNLKTVQIGGNPWLCDCRNSLSKFFEIRNIVHGPDEGCIARRNSTSNGCSTNVYDCMTTLEYPALPAPQSTFTQIEKHYHGRFEWRDIIATGISNLDKLPDECSWIQLLNVEIPTIRRYTFFRFGNTLRSIELSNCGIREIEREAFGGLHKLERLILVGNGLRTIGHDWFRDLGRLRHLILRHNDIEKFEEHSLVHLRELKTLDISENRLNCLDKNILWGLMSLEKLEATGNPWMCECKSGLENYLTGKRIGYDISSGRCELRNSNINGGQDYKFTWNSTMTGTIRWSWASKHHWPPVPRPTYPPTLPPTVPPTTTTPRIIYTPPTRPHRTGGCTVNNAGQRTKIDTCICRRASLYDLADVPVTVKTIKFSGSVITTIYSNAFTKFGNYLRHLEFRECSIEAIDSRAFHGLWSLDTLVIRGNYLRVVESAWFEHTTNLRTLDLARNRITRIDSGVFDKLPHLVRLDVSDNLMNCISTEHIMGLKYLRELEVTDNPWICLCAIKLMNILMDKGLTCNCNPSALIQKIEGDWGCGQDSPVVHPTSPSWSRPPTQPPPTQARPTYTPPPRPHPWSTYTPPTTAVSPTLPPGPPTGNCVSNHHNTDGGPWYNCANGDIYILGHIPSYITRIEIKDSYIPNLPASIFSRFENLTDLVLINCTLSNIDQRAFTGLTKLQRITLRHNRCTIVKNGWFRETPNIVWIDLSDNDLSEIETGSFLGLNRLEYLNFEGNSFRCIYTSSLVGLPRLATVEFGRNNRQLSWRCWEKLEEYLVVRDINFTNYNCPRDGKYVVRTWLKDDKSHAQAITAGTTANFHSVTILAICLIAVIRLNV